MKQFYGQMTKEELKCAVYSGEHLQEFAEMCEAVGVHINDLRISMPNAWSKADSFARVSSDAVNLTILYKYKCIYGNNPEDNIQWQPEPDEDLLKIVELCGGVWPENGLKGIARGWHGLHRGRERSPDYLRLALDEYISHEYTIEQFEAAKVYIERQRKQMSPLEAVQDIMGVCFDTCEIKEVIKNTGKEAMSKTPEIKHGSWISLEGLNLEQAQCCMNWLAEKSNKNPQGVSKSCSKYDFITVSERCGWVLFSNEKTRFKHPDLEIKVSDILPDELRKAPEKVIHNDKEYTLICKPLEIDQKVYTFRGDRLAVYRIEEDRVLLCDCQWYALDDITTDGQVIKVCDTIKSDIIDNTGLFDASETVDRKVFVLAKKIVDSLK